MYPAWLLVVVAVMGVAGGDVSLCWEHPSCQDVNSETSMMECVELCRSDLTAEAPVVPGAAHLQPPPPPSEALPILSLLSSPSSPSSPQAKRSYSMEHFRWGKPVGRKRRPVKVYAPNGVEEESAELYPPGEMRRRELMEDEKKDGAYKMKHFRWSGPPASKRYGGFMRSWDERDPRPLLTLLKNVLNTEGRQ
uniref:Corticotropin n=1 Tax=Gasterosteus aculeatus aculeatus TaxID=481459 RepID=G3P4M9_GASAC